jgi:hypothetical protein
MLVVRSPERYGHPSHDQYDIDIDVDIDPDHTARTRHERPSVHLGFG